MKWRIRLPLANRLFPNPYVHVSFEEGWRAHLSNDDLASRWQIPLQITVQGDHVEGFLGPLFLLAPLALLALRFREGRQLLLAAAIFGCTYFGNIGTRFLIPVVPFVSLALALAVLNIPWLLLTLVIAHGITCWPGVYDLYCAHDAFRIDNVPVMAALRLQPEEAISARIPNSRRSHDRLRRPSRRAGLRHQPGRPVVFTARSVGGYESASNEVLQDILWTPVVRAFQPTRVLKFDFPPRELRKLRVVQTASLPHNQWSIAELRVSNRQSELPRDPGWRLTAHPNPWDVQLAFDNSPVTRWRSWQPATPGMYVEVEFGRLNAPARW